MDADKIANKAAYPVTSDSVEMIRNFFGHLYPAVILLAALFWAARSMAAGAARPASPSTQVSQSAPIPAECAHLKPTTARFRTMTYNVWGLPGPLLTDSTRFADIARIAPAYDADLISFNETFSGHAHKLSRMPAYPHVAWGPTKGIAMLSSGLLLVSKHPILETHTLIYSACSGSDCGANKGALHARILAGAAGVIDVFTTHLNAGDNGEVRESQLQELGEFMRYYSDSSRPALLLGDLNFSPKSHLYTKAQTYLGLPMRDVHAESVTLNPGLSDIQRRGITYDGDRNPNAHGGSRIDYTWVRGGTETQLCTVISKLVFDEPTGDRFLSDHFGVAADFLVQSPSTDGSHP